METRIIQELEQKWRFMTMKQGKLEHILKQLIQHWDTLGDVTRKAKGIELLSKLRKKEYTIAFCGHFSAGKSTLINELLGTTILPSSPIPTSANLVKITSGNHYVKALFKEKGEQILVEPENIEEIHRLCRDGDLIYSLEISTPRAQLPEGLAIVDTPGIDSTDDAHRVAAESQLHLTDFVIYVMDYNHVQSQVNFSFIQQLNKKRKAVTLVINQLDKHKKEELSFSLYREKIKTSLEEQGLMYEAIFFISAKDRNAPHNELDLLKRDLEKKINERGSHLEKSILNELIALLKEHLQWLYTRKQNELAEYEQILKPYTFQEESRFQNDLIRLKDDTRTLGDLIDTFEQELLQKVETVLANANIMPYHTRNMARDYVEGEQIGFRVKGLFSSRKTKGEKERRFLSLYKELQENTTTYIDIHLKEVLSKHVKKYELFHEDLKQAIHEFKGDIPPKIITGSLRRGALFSHEYVLNYSQTVIQEIKSHYQRKVTPLIELAKEKLIMEYANDEKEKVRRRDELERKLAACNGIKRILVENKRDWEKNVEILEPIFTTKEERTCFGQEETFVFVKEKAEALERRYLLNISDRKKDIEMGNKNRLGEIEIMQKNGADALQNLLQYIEKEQALAAYTSHLQEKRRRLENKQFTIALFGAFSAGKSSFANALLGEALLPVSPNPTTATINKILPPTDVNCHGTIIVHMKKEENVLKDINNILEKTEQHVQTMIQLLQLLKKREQIMAERKKNIEEKENREKEKIQQKEGEDPVSDPFRFLTKQDVAVVEAFAKGYENQKTCLGQTLKVSYEQFTEMVQTETTAAFIEEINVYYESTITKQGITLVDTPGADSIHARHTETAFEYIKNADAVLFVTYYNHAFSRADKEFLIQLGRVKECFTRDKMFFIINAADLAETDQELSDVTEHVEKNLLTCGIRSPQIYPVSSLFALLGEKYKNNTITPQELIQYKKAVPASWLMDGKTYFGITSFETAFYQFTIADMVKLVLEGILENISQLEKRLTDWIEKGKLAEEERKLKLEEALMAKEFVCSSVKELPFQLEKEQVIQEIQELMYYVKQRVFYRYFDEFKERINPPRFYQVDNFKEELEKGIKELIEFLSFDLHQEMRATNLRLETFVKNLLTEKMFRFNKSLEQQVGTLPFLSISLETSIMSSFPKPLKDIKLKDVEKLYADDINVNNFFIEKAHFQLRDELEEQLRPHVVAYIEQVQNNMGTIWMEWLKEEVQVHKRRWLTVLTDYFNKELEILTVQANQEHLYMLRSKISEVSSKFPKME